MVHKDALVVSHASDMCFVCIGNAPVEYSTGYEEGFRAGLEVATFLNVEKISEQLDGGASEIGTLKPDPVIDPLPDKHTAAPVDSLSQDKEIARRGKEIQGEHQTLQRRTPPSILKVTDIGITKVRWLPSPVARFALCSLLVDQAVPLIGDCSEAEERVEAHHRRSHQDR